MLDLHFNGGVFLFMSDNPPVGASFFGNEKAGAEYLAIFRRPGCLLETLGFLSHPRE
jgi:hypothetical protein